MCGAMAAFAIMFRIECSGVDKFYVRWKCGSWWLLVHECRSEASANEWIAAARSQRL